MIPPNTFHWANGWMFKRVDDGSVRIWNETAGVSLLIPPYEWASIVGHLAHVHPGDEGLKYTAALHLHDFLTP